MKKTERLIALLSLGFMLISGTFSWSVVHRQNVQKENALIELQNKNKADTMNILIWRKYHEDQMVLMTQILNELQKKNSITPVCAL